MSNVRIDEDIISIVSELKSQIDELKGLQVVGGDSVVTFKNQTSATWDVNQASQISGVNVYFPPFTKVVTFTPDNVIDDRPAGSFQLAYSSTREMTPQSQYDPTSVRYVEISRLEPVDPRQQRYKVYVPDDHGNQGQTGFRRLKFFVLATAKGTVTITDS